MKGKEWFNGGYKKTFMSAAVLLVIVCAGAKVRNVRSADKFYTTLERNRLVLMFFYQENRTLKRDADYRHGLAMTNSMFERVSKSCLYKEGDLLCIRGNVEDCSIESVRNKFGITTVPAFALFKEGRLVRNKKTGEPAILQGFASQEELRTFIDKNIGKALERRREMKAEDRARFKACRDAYWSIYWPYYTGCGYPYGGCGWYGAPCGYGGCGSYGYVGFGFNI